MNLKKIIFLMLVSGAIFPIISFAQFPGSNEPNTSLGSDPFYNPDAFNQSQNNAFQDNGVFQNQNNGVFNSKDPGGFNNVDLDNDGQTTVGFTCGTRPRNIGELFEFTLCLLQGSVVPFLVGLGLIIFLFGVLKYVSAGDNEEKRESGRGMMIFGIIALFVMISVWGFVRILHQSFFAGDAFELPSLPKRAKDPFQGN